jgi:hypothetical protein
VARPLLDREHATQVTAMAPKGKPESPAFTLGGYSGSCTIMYSPPCPFTNHQFLERLTAQIRPRAIKHLAGPREGLALGVFGTQRTVDAAEGNPELLRDGPQRRSRVAQTCDPAAVYFQSRSPQRAAFVAGIADASPYALGD